MLAASLLAASVLAVSVPAGSLLGAPIGTASLITGSLPAGRSWYWDEGRRTGPSHMSIDPTSSGSKVRGTQAASSSIRRTPKEYS